MSSSIITSIVDVADGFSTLEDRVREHVTFARETPFLRKELKDKVSGYVYDLKDGSLKKID